MLKIGDESREDLWFEMQPIPAAAQIIGLAPGNLFSDDLYLDHISLIMKNHNSSVIVG